MDLAGKQYMYLAVPDRVVLEIYIVHPLGLVKQYYNEKMVSYGF